MIFKILITDIINKTDGSCVATNTTVLDYDTYAEAMAAYDQLIINKLSSPNWVTATRTVIKLW